MHAITVEVTLGRDASHPTSALKTWTTVFRENRAVHARSAQVRPH